MRQRKPYGLLQREAELSERLDGRQHGTGSGDDGKPLRPLSVELEGAVVDPLRDLAHVGGEEHVDEGIHRFR